MSSGQPVRVLFVCMGNICRSPMAEALFRHLVVEAGLEEAFVVDSAGTGGWHAGEAPHYATSAVLKRHGIDVGDQRARRLKKEDSTTFDYIVAMDRENIATITQNHPAARERTRLLLDYVTDSPDISGGEVPDPYYSGAFEHVYELVEKGCRALLAHIRAERGF
ncbi:low molecular weight protein-tyrosine-phosphatase [Candidatus Chloroploca sp. Khr17]|uniref:low molecular weight protein-tyrosine-phosphatase n=1 Tax=Candidatus Chloroploca sp. Khr17 TaxID=2496869 RepID=UPI00101BA209|nr:low molecular weight protein-tyrosine-phosphatase [Candidatus Chloroploca sp. Khr17]